MNEWMKMWKNMKKLKEEKELFKKRAKKLPQLLEKTFKGFAFWVGN